MDGRRRLADVRAMAGDQLIEVFPIHMARASSFFAVVALLLMAPWAYVLGGAAIAALWSREPGWALGLGVLAAGPIWATGRILPEAFPGRAHLALTPGALAVRHRVLLRRRLEIPIETVDRVEVIVEPVTGPALPLASHVVTDVPNVAVFLRTPVDVKAIRRKPASSGAVGVPRLSDVDLLGGFAVRVDDPDAVARAFDRWRLLRVGPSATGHPRASRLRLAQVAAAVFLVISLAEAIAEAF